MADRADLGYTSSFTPTTVRSEKDHSLMPGIQAGEIGPKIHNAMGSLDNGWARFDQVRIPRSHMLSRFAQVTEDGQYVKPPHSKVSYGGMLFIRAQMISSLSWRMAKGECALSFPRTLFQQS